MGRVSLYEDINDRLIDDAINVAGPRVKVASINHLPEGEGARPPKLRRDIELLWRNFKEKVQALQTCHARSIETHLRKRKNFIIVQAIESSHLNEEMIQSMEKLANAYPVKHQVRIALENGLSRIRQCNGKIAH